MITVNHIIASPRSGKTTSCIKHATRALITYPKLSVGYVTYNRSVADQVARQIQRQVPEARKPVGLGVGAAIGRQSFKLLFLDDLIKDLYEAESVEVRAKLLAWLQHAVVCRMAPESHIASISSFEEQMRLVVAAFGHSGVQVKNQCGAWDDELEAKLGNEAYQRIHQGMPHFT